MAMRPDSTSVSLRRDLSAVFNEFDEKKAADRFIARRAAPGFHVAEQSGKYPVFNRENFQKLPESARAADGGYNRIVGEFGDGLYSCDEHGLEFRIDDKRRRRYQTFFGAEIGGTRILWFNMMLLYEKRVADLYASTAIPTTAVSTVWTTVATADPVGDIAIAAQKIEDASGVDQSELSLIIPRADYREMVATDQFTEQIKYTVPGVRPAVLPSAAAAEILGIKEVLVAKGNYDSAIEGETIVHAQIWPSTIMYLALLAEDGDPLEIPSAFRTFFWDADAPEMPVMESYREENTRSDILRARDDTDEAATGTVGVMAQEITN